MEPNRPNPLRLAAVAAPSSSFLPANFVLGSHIVDDFICHDGVVATYLGHHLASGEPVLIREYFPVAVSSRVADQYVEPASLPHHAEFADGLAAFVDRARRLQRIESPYLNPVVDVIEFNDTAYLLSAEVDGEMLDRWVSRSAPLNDTQIVELAIRVLRAIEALHGQGLVHAEVCERRLLVSDGGEIVLLHAESLLHAGLFGRSAEAAHAGADLSALAALLTRLCHAGGDGPPPAPSAVVGRDRSPMLMMLIERALPGSRELDSLDAARWRKSFERLRSHLAIGEVPRTGSTAIVKAESLVVGHLSPAAPVFPIVVHGADKAPGPARSPGFGERLVVWLEVGLVPALIVVAWLMLAPGEGDRPDPDAPAPAAVAAPPATVAPSLPATGPARPEAGIDPAMTQSPADPVERNRRTDGNAIPAPPVEVSAANVQTGAEATAVTNPAEAIPPAAVADGADGNETIEALLAGARADIAARRMTVPPGNNAMEKFQAVLRLDRANDEARRGLRQIADGLAAVAGRMLANGAKDAEIEGLLRRARAAEPKNARAAQVEEALNERRKAAEPARIDEPYPPQVKHVEPAPPPPPPPPEPPQVNRADELRQRFGGR